MQGLPEKRRRVTKKRLSTNSHTAVRGTEAELSEGYPSSQAATPGLTSNLCRKVQPCARDEQDQILDISNRKVTATASVAPDHTLPMEDQDPSSHNLLSGNSVESSFNPGNERGARPHFEQTSNNGGQLFPYNQGPFCHRSNIPHTLVGGQGHLISVTSKLVGLYHC